MPRLLMLSLAVLCALTVAACGSRHTPTRTTHRRTHASAAGLAGQGLAYARCMRSHGVTNFPDPVHNGGVSFQGSTSSPAFRSAQTACAPLEPRKVAPSHGNETPRQVAEDHAQLLRWAKCMRHRGYPKLPDPKIGTPQPTPGYGTVLGWGAAYLEIPDLYDGHSQAFLNTAKTCGINPVTGNPHH
ncbi:MAG: hypothetical protein ACRDQ1_08115 [Sciscionella sp.]